MAAPESDSSHDLFARVDALLAGLPPALPDPDERRRLRIAAKLSQVRIAELLGVTRAAVAAWESGANEPRPPHGDAYARLLEGLAERYPRPQQPLFETPAPHAVPTQPAAPHGPVDPAATERDTAEPTTQPTRATTPAAADEDVAPSTETADSTRRRAPSDPPPSPCVPENATADSDQAATPQARRTAASTAEARQAPASATADSHQAATPPDPARHAPATSAKATSSHPGGPLAVFDATSTHLTAHLPTGQSLPCPARTIPDLAAWALDDAGMGAPRLDDNGRDADPLLVLTAPAAELLGLPPALDDRVHLRLPAKHPVVKAVAKHGWQLTRRGFGPWARVYQPATTGRGRRCVQFAVLPWGALDAKRSWPGTDRFTPAQLAAALGRYTARVLTPKGSTAVNGLELMTALRPPTRAVKKPDGTWGSGPVEGSLTEAVDPAPPEAPDEHPVAQSRAADDVLVEEAFDWIRDFDALTADEGALPYAVGIDVCTAFLAAANGLSVGLGAPEHVDRPAFDKTVPGCWLVDLSHDLTALNHGLLDHGRLPNPFTPDGLAPEGPAWYATPTVAYAVELGLDVTPLAGWLRPHPKGPYLAPWYQRLRDAYVDTMADLGVTTKMPPQDFLDAMRAHSSGDPVSLAVLGAVKATVKGGIGKLRERPQGVDYRVGERWSALDRPTWRPDIRAAVISAARVNMHRKMVRTAAATGRHPLAVATDCVVYAATGPSPLDALAYTGDTPVGGTFRLGVSPGMVKHEGTQSMAWALEGLDTGVNIARHIKTGALPHTDTAAATTADTPGVPGTSGTPGTAG